MNASAACIFVGGIALLIALIGGKGIEGERIKIPPLGPVTRLLAFLLGLFLTSTGIVTSRSEFITYLLQRVGSRTPTIGESDISIPQHLMNVNIPAQDNQGVAIVVPYSGTYVFRYRGAESVFWNGINWDTVVVGYLGSSVLWADDSNLNHEAAMFEMGNYGYNTKESAIDATNGQEARVSLNEGDDITLVAGDLKFAYSDNVGDIELEILFVSND